MEIHTLKVNSSVVDTQTLIKGKTKKIVVKKYYDLDGQKINEGTDTQMFDKPVDFEITKKTIRYDWNYSEPTFGEDWEVKVNGKRINKDLEFVAYRHSSTQLTLHGCSGHG